MHFIILDYSNDESENEYDNLQSMSLTLNSCQDILLASTENSKSEIKKTSLQQFARRDKALNKILNDNYELNAKTSKDFENSRSSYLTTQSDLKYNLSHKFQTQYNDKFEESSFWSSSSTSISDGSDDSIHNHLKYRHRKKKRNIQKIRRSR